MTNRSITILAGSMCLIIVFAVTVWPTRYRYDHVSAQGTVLPVRIDRFSGRTEILRGMSGWVAVEAPKNTRSARMLELPAAERVKVTGNAGLLYGTLFEGKLYNASSFYLREVVVTITAQEESGALRWSRQFKDEVFIEPLTTGNFQIQVTGAEGARLSWTIDQLKGEPRG